MEKYFNEKKKDETLRILNGIKEIADEKGCSMAQLALAWAVVNQDVSTCIFGASKVEQVEDNIQALQIAQKWDKELEEKINKLLGNEPEPIMDFNVWQPRVPRRGVRVDYHMQPNLQSGPFDKFQESTLKKKKE